MSFFYFTVPSITWTSRVGKMTSKEHDVRWKSCKKKIHINVAEKLYMSIEEILFGLNDTFFPMINVWSKFYVKLRIVFHFVVICYCFLIESYYCKFHTHNVSQARKERKYLITSRNLTNKIIISRKRTFRNLGITQRNWSKVLDENKVMPLS